jgi:hypothetical protein
MKHQSYTYYCIVKPKNINIKSITFEQIKKIKKQCKFNILVTYKNNEYIELLDNKYIYEINGDEDDIDNINIDDIGSDVKFYMLSDSSYTQSCSVSGGKRTRKIVKKNSKRKIVKKNSKRKYKISKKNKF